MTNKKIMSLRFEGLTVMAISFLVAFAGLINLFSASYPVFFNRQRLLHALFPILIIHGARVISVIAGFFLLILAFNLWRHKEVARTLSIVMLLISALAHLLKGFDWVGATYMIGLAVTIFYFRPFFHAKSDPPSVKNGLIILLIALFFTLAYSTVGFYFVSRHFHTHLNLADSIKETFRVVTQFPSPRSVSRSTSIDFFVISIYLIEFVTLGYSLLKIFTPVFIRIRATSKDREKANELVSKYGDSVLARFALFEDKHYFFYKNATIAYAVFNRTALALGDPIGEKKDTIEAIDQFKTFCQTNDWRPVFYQTSDGYLKPFQKYGFSSLKIGFEAIIHTKNFTLDGSENKKLRSAYNRIKTLGYKLKIWVPPISRKKLEELRAISDNWLEKKNGEEEGYSLGWFDDEYIRNSSIAVLQDPNKIPVAFANLVPGYTKKEVAIDLMRFIDTGENGLMEFFFAELIFDSKKEYETFNLGLSPLAGVGLKSDDLMAEKALRFVYNNLNHWHGYQGLYHFKAKFHPDWQPRYLNHLKGQNILAIMLALVKAHR